MPQVLHLTRSVLLPATLYCHGDASVARVALAFKKAQQQGSGAGYTKGASVVSSVKPQVRVGYSRVSCCECIIPLVVYYTQNACATRIYVAFTFNVAPGPGTTPAVPSAAPLSLLVAALLTAAPATDACPAHAFRVLPDAGGACRSPTPAAS